MMKFLFTSDPKKDFECPLCGAPQSTAERTMRHMWKFQKTNANNKRCNKYAKTVHLYPRLFTQGDKSNLTIDILDREYPQIKWESVQKLILNQEWDKLTKEPFNIEISNKELKKLNQTESHQIDSNPSKTKRKPKPKPKLKPKLTKTKSKSKSKSQTKSQTKSKTKSKSKAKPKIKNKSKLKEKTKMKKSNKSTTTKFGYFLSYF